MQTSKLPKVLSDLMTAQNEYDADAFARCFSTDAIVFDEGEEHHGIPEIKSWNEKTNKKYHTVLSPIDFSATSKESVLKVVVSGAFEGSPIPLNYKFTIAGDKITTLRIQ